MLGDTMIDEYGSRNLATRSEYAQVNLGAVLFAVADTSIEARPDLRTPKVPEQAMIAIPPFKVIGRIHLLPERSLSEALWELTGRFIPVTDATYWSETVGEARQSAPMVAINHQRAQIFAPHREVDPWAGLDRSAGSAETASPGGQQAPGGDPAWPEVSPFELRAGTPPTAFVAQACVSARHDRAPERAGSTARERGAQAATRRWRARARQSAVDRQVEAVAPFRPAAVVDRDVVVAHAGSATKASFAAPTPEPS